MTEHQNLIEKIKLGDEIAFEQLFKQHFTGLCLFAEHFVKDTSVAEEIVEDLFCDLWENCADISINSSFKAYLYRCVYNNSLKYLRHKKVTQKYISAQQAYYTDKELCEISIQTYPIANLIIKELEEKINEAINSLPSQCKEIFCLNRFEGLSYTEIAEKTDLSINTVKTQMARALQKMRVELKDYLYFIAITISLIQ
jgi:RNA polymerase sigma-70 factor, ECF subfamily